MVLVRYDSTTSETGFIKKNWHFLSLINMCAHKSIWNWVRIKLKSSTNTGGKQERLSMTGEDEEEGLFTRVCVYSGQDSTTSWRCLNTTNLHITSLQSAALQDLKETRFYRSLIVSGVKDHRTGTRGAS